MSSPSKKVVSSVTSFVAGRNLNGKPVPSTLELMLASRRLTRQTKELTHGKPSALTSLFTSAWDTLMAALMTVLIGSLRIFLFLFFWGLLLMALPTILSHL
jgi:hypothetical protein